MNLQKSYKLVTSRFGYLWLKIVLTKRRKVFQKISKSIKTIWLIELSMCPLENQSSAKDLQQSLVQKSNEYKLAYISTVYFKKSCKLFKRLIAIFNCRLKISSNIGTVYLNFKVMLIIQKADCHFQMVG